MIGDRESMLIMNTPGRSKQCIEMNSCIITDILRRVGASNATDFLWQFPPDILVTCLGANIFLPPPPNLLKYYYARRSFKLHKTGNFNFESIKITIF